MPVALCDAALWTVVGLLRLLAWSGAPLPAETGAAVALVLLPVSWAGKPLAYALSTLLDRRRRERQQRLLKIVMARSRLAEK